MVRTTEWKYVTDPLGDLDELYDLRADPWELTNRAADPAFAATIADLRRLLLEWALTTEDHRPPPLPSPAPRLGTTTRSSS
jgi:arylsulfatase A-like enzyme